MTKGVLKILRIDVLLYCDCRVGVTELVRGAAYAHLLAIVVVEASVSVLI